MYVLESCLRIFTPQQRDAALADVREKLGINQNWNKSESNNPLRKACPRRPTHGRRLQPQTGFQMKEEEEDEQEEEGKEEGKEEEDNEDEDQEEGEEEEEEDEDDNKEEEEDDEEKEEKDDVIDFP